MAVQSLLALRAIKELLRTKLKEQCAVFFVWAYFDEALGWAACSGFIQALGHRLRGVKLLGLCLFHRVEAVTALQGVALSLSRLS